MIQLTSCTHVLPVPQSMPCTHHNICTVIGQLTCWSDAEGLEDVLQAQLQTYAGMEEIESIASTCSRSINSRGESDTSHGPYIHRLSLSKGSTNGDSAHSSPGGCPVHGVLWCPRSALACCVTLRFVHAQCALLLHAVVRCSLLMHAAPSSCMLWHAALCLCMLWLATLCCGMLWSGECL